MDPENIHFVSLSFINKQKISSVNVSESFECFFLVSMSNQFDIKALLLNNIYDR